MEKRKPRKYAVKLLYDIDQSGLQSLVNDFLEVLEDFQLIDIKFLESGYHFNALIIYKGIRED